MRFYLPFRCAVIATSLILALPATTITGQAVKVAPKKVTPDLGGGTLTVSAAPTIVSFSLVKSGTAVGNSPVSITTSWTGIALLSPLLSTVTSQLPAPRSSEL